MGLRFVLLCVFEWLSFSLSNFNWECRVLGGELCPALGCAAAKFSQTRILSMLHPDSSTPTNFCALLFLARRQLFGLACVYKLYAGPITDYLFCRRQILGPNFRLSARTLIVMSPNSRSRTRTVEKGVGAPSIRTRHSHDYYGGMRILDENLNSSDATFWCRLPKIELVYKSESLKCHAPPHNGYFNVTMMLFFLFYCHNYYSC